MEQKESERNKRGVEGKVRKTRRCPESDFGFMENAAANPLCVTAHFASQIRIPFFFFFHFGREFLAFWGGEMSPSE